MPDALVNGIKVNYVSAGEGDPVILVHGFTASHDMWWGQLPALVKAGYKAIAYDVRGHGDSGRPEPGFDVGTLVADLDGLMDELGIERAHVAGLSMGGIIGQRFCMDKPERCATLTAADTFPGKPDYGTMAVFNEHSRLVAEVGVAGLFEHLLEHPALPVGPDYQVPVEFMEVYRQSFLKNDPSSLAEFVRLFASLPDWTGELSSIKCPVLLIAGERDTPCLAPMRKMQKALPRSELHLIPRAGHASAIEKPEEFNDILVTFLQKYSDK